MKSVNGKTGEVALTAKDVGAVAAVNGVTPDENGNVQIEVGSGENVDLTGYATEQFVRDGYQPKGKYLTTVPEGYAKTEDIPTKPEDIGAQPAGNYLTEVPTDYATEEFVKNKIAEAELGGEEVDLSGYAQKSELPTKVSQLQNDSGYLTEHQDISGKLDASALPTAIITALAQAKASGEFDGADGKDGKDGAPGEKGDKGDPGEPGQKGEQGIQGIPGEKGEKGEKGDTGAPGADGAKGDKGDKGDTGATGAQGEHGKDGANGKDGTSATHSWNGTVLTVTSASGTSSADLKGAKGDKGDKGDSIKGDPGSDGVSPTVTVSKSGKVTTVSITDKNGTKTATINDGVDGSPGSAGKDGTSVTVKSVSESTADGGSNVVTFSDGKTLTVKNGSKGSTGDKGDTGATGQRGTGLLSVTTAPSSYTTAVGGITPKYRMAISTIKTQAGVTEVLLGDTIRYSYYHYPIAYLDASYAYFTTRVSIRGSTGTTPVKGTDYFTADDKAEMVEDVVAEMQSTILEPADGDIPKVFLTGSEFSNMTTDKNEVNMEMEYRSKTKQFSAYILIKYQGRSSLAKPKKNFTIKMYSDEARASKQKMAFKDWRHETHKYVLKANFIDHTHARNIIGANLWSEVVASRSDYATLPEELRNSPRNGAIDGFPVKLYVNGTYQGIYTWNIGKDDWMWGLDEDNPNHFLLANEGDQGSSVVNSGNFRKEWNGVDESHWTVEVGTNSYALKTSLNNLITFVMNNTGSAFRSGIGSYLDIQSAIDYYIHQYVICNIDSLALNMLLATYDSKVWRCGAYDMDSTFGNWWTGEKFLPATYKCPEDYQDKFSLLWERLEENFWPEIQERYAELRKTVYTASNMFTHFERFTDTIGNDLYAEDLEVYPDIPQGSTCNIKQLRNFIRDRLVYCDSQITNGIPGTAVSLSETSLTIDTSSGGSATLTATKTPSNTTDDIYWYSSDTEIATVANGVVTAVAEGSCTIYARCGSGWASCSVTVSSAVEPDEPETSAYTNLVPTSIDSDGSVYNGTGYKDGYRLSSSGTVSGTALETATHTGFIPVKKGDVIRIKIVGGFNQTGAGNYVCFYNSNRGLIKADYPETWKDGSYGTTETLADGSVLITGFTANNTGIDNTTAYFRVSLNPAKGANLIVTVNQEIT